MEKITFKKRIKEESLVFLGWIVYQFSKYQISRLDLIEESEIKELHEVFQGRNPVIANFFLCVINWRNIKQEAGQQ